MNQKVFNVGVAGIGDISDAYLQNLFQHSHIVRLYGCASRGLEKAQKKAERFSMAKAFGSVDEMIADPEIDLILNLTTPDVHAAINIAALQAGKHVYTEKPLAANYAEASEIMKIAEQQGLRVGSAPDTFMGARLQTMRSLMDQGVIGRVTGASAFVASHGWEWFHPSPQFFYQPGAGPLLDIGPYYITALLSLLGPAQSCVAMASRAEEKRLIHSMPDKGKYLDVNVQTHITGNIEFCQGAIATIMTSFDVWDSELPRLEIYGTKGTLCMAEPDPNSGPNLFGGELLLCTEKNYRWKQIPRPEQLDSWEKVELKHPFRSVSHEENHRGIGLLDMVLAIREGRPHRASGEMALHSMELMEAILRSAEERCFCYPQTRFERPEALPENFSF